MFKRAGLFVFVLMLSCTAVMAQQDPFIGTWKQNMTKSTYDPPSVARTSFMIRYEASGNNAYTINTKGVTSQGKAIHTENTVTLDGNDCSQPGSPNGDSMSVRKINAHTTISINKKGGAVVRMMRNVVSEDGKTLTGDIVGYTPQGDAFYEHTVFDKQ